MKKTALLAALALAAASCQNDEPGLMMQDIASDITPKPGSTITFTAGQERAGNTLQKAEYSAPGTIVWQGSEHFSVFPKGEETGADFAAESASAGKTECTITGSCKEAESYRAIYPYSSAATFSDEKYSGIAMPAAQDVPSDGQFDPKADIMVAYTTSSDMNFKFMHIGAKLGVTVPAEGITSIEITSSEDIAGSVEVSLGTGSGAVPVIESVSGASKTIKLSCAQGCFEMGKTYYACLLPTSKKSSIKLKFIIGSDQYYEVLFLGSIDAMKRATLNNAAPPADKGHTLLRKSAVEKVIPMDRMLGRTAKTIVFDYLKNVSDDIKAEGNCVLSSGGLKVYSPESDVFYFLSENDIYLDEDMAELFYKCHSMTTLTLKNFHTDYVTNMKSMFEECKKLENVDVSGFNTENVTNMSYMFSQLGLDAENPVNLDLSSFDTQNVTDMSFMFAGNTPFQSLTAFPQQSYSNNIASITWQPDLSTAKVENMKGMFMGCQFKEIDLEIFNTASVTNMSGMFEGCPNLEKIEIPDNWDTKNVTDMSGMFQNCYSLIDLNLAELSTSNVTNMSYMFSKLGITANESVNLNIASFDTQNVTDMSFMFAGETKISIATLSMDVTYVNKIASITWPSDLSTAKVENMSGMFTGCKFDEIDLEIFNTASVSNMSGMFCGCTNLTTIEIPDNWDTKNVTNISGMFQECTYLTDLNLANLNTENVVDMSYLFYCTGAYASESFTLDLSSFNTSKVTDMSYMFTGKRRVKKLPFEFEYRSKLQEVDLSSFKTNSVLYFDDMFASCVELSTIYASNNFTINEAATSQYMFSGCTLLPGYDGNIVDKTYARIGSGSEIGYFSAKP